MKIVDKLLGYYNYTVILTYFGLVSGFAGIVCAMDGNAYAAVVCLMVAGFCDMFDGAVASTMERTREEKNFGIQIDSLSDLVCFGVLPAVLAYSLSERTHIAFAAAALYVLCALIRLAYFNVTEEERQLTEEGSRKIYYGLPVTASALLIPMTYAICELADFVSTRIMTAVLAVIAVLFVLPFPLTKPGKTGKIVLVMAGVMEIILLVLAGGKV